MEAPQHAKDFGPPILSLLAPNRQSMMRGGDTENSTAGEEFMPKSPDYFAGKTIIITGAASGIGRAAALIFAREKANVVCADIDEAGVEKTAEKINDIGSQALALAIDVTKRAAVEDMVQLAIDGFGSVQFLFNSAGAAKRRGKFLEIYDAPFEKTFGLYFTSTV